jgi:hypothetical protein
VNASRRCAFVRSIPKLLPIRHCLFRRSLFGGFPEIHHEFSYNFAKNATFSNDIQYLQGPGLSVICLITDGDSLSRGYSFARLGLAQGREAAGSGVCYDSGEGRRLGNALR